MGARLQPGLVTIVSGVASGIGRATAERFGHAGWIVVGIDLVDGKGVSLVGDVADEATWVAAVRLVAERFGRLDVLINNAGTNVRGTVEEADRPTWDRIMAVNLTSVYLGAKHCLPLLKATRGAIVNVSSGAGLVGVQRGAAYAASKGGAIALTRQMAVDYASAGVRVNAVCPGVVDTPLVRRLAAGDGTREPPLDQERLGMPAETELDQELLKMAAGQPLKRLGTPDEIAYAIFFLASPEASFITGAILAVDGGYTAR